MVVNNVEEAHERVVRAVGRPHAENRVLAGCGPYRVDGEERSKGDSEGRQDAGRSNDALLPFLAQYSHIFIPPVHQLTRYAKSKSSIEE